ncbi:MAG: hypothetical protein MI919_23535, partial [Holophagales bacterium]|nr:hypothetical protein [Holophagales bacterium]
MFLFILLSRVETVDRCRTVTPFFPLATFVFLTAFGSLAVSPPPASCHEPGEPESAVRSAPPAGAAAFDPRGHDPHPAEAAGNRRSGAVRSAGPRHRLQVLPTTLGGEPADAPEVEGLLATLTGELQRRLAATGRLTVIGIGGATDPEVHERPQFLVHAVVESWPAPAVRGPGVSSEEHGTGGAEGNGRQRSAAPPPVRSFRILSGGELQVLYTTRVSLAAPSERAGRGRDELIEAGMAQGVGRLTSWLSRNPWRG